MVIILKMKLSLLAILLGVGLGLPQVYGLLHPAGLAAAARKFPRNLPAGVVLMLLATVWFAWNVNVEPIADFSAFKPYMLGAFIAVGILSCIFVQDFLAVRGLAVLLLLLAKFMVDTGRPYLPTTYFSTTGESSWVLVIQVLGLRVCGAGHLVHHHAVAAARFDQLGDGFRGARAHPLPDPPRIRGVHR